MAQGSDTMDVWFDPLLLGGGAGRPGPCQATCDDLLAAPGGQALNRGPSINPADLYLEVSDQHRGCSRAACLSRRWRHGQAPYKRCSPRLHLDEEGSQDEQIPWAMW